jgi:hypothetical protein
LRNAVVASEDNGAAKDNEQIEIQLSQVCLGGYRALFWRTALPKASGAACDADPGDKHRRGRRARLWRSAACRDRAGDGEEMSDAMTQARDAHPQR